MKYRPEINGLRAVAILPVILFHAGNPWISGGFIGVDVFFVISGFLIGGLLFRQIEAKNFSFIEFFSRRSGRLLPGLFTVILFSIPFALLLVPTSQLENFGWSVVGAATFTSNLFFAFQSDYFATNEIRPLLHTWSLGVEEQFYLLIPLLLWFAFKRTKTTKTWLVLLSLLSIASLIVAIWLSEASTQLAYYLLITRFWELGIGALAAYLIHSKITVPSNLGAWKINVLLSIGTLGIIVPMFLINKDIPYPGILTLVPVLSTGIVLMYSGERSYVNRILKLKPFVIIGLLSYSLYLWHQPIFVLLDRYLSKLKQFHDPVLFQILAIFLTLILSVLSYKFIETPVRRLSHTPRHKKQIKILVIALVSSLIISVMGYGIVTFASNSEKQLFNEASSGNMVLHPTPNYCENFNETPNEIKCKKFGHGDIKIVIWGDSHSEMLANTMPKEFVNSNNYSTYIISVYGCPPIVGVKRADKIGNSKNCDRISENKEIFSYINALRPESVVLVARWSMYLNGWRWGNQLLPETHFVNDETTEKNDALTSTEVVNRHLAQTIEGMQAQKVFVVSQPPDLQEFTQQIRETNSFVSQNTIDKWHRTEDDLFSKISDSATATIVPTREAYCDGTRCKLQDEMGFPLYKDDNHPSAIGAKLIWTKIISSGLLGHK